MAVAFVNRTDANFASGGTYVSPSSAWTNGHLFTLLLWEYGGGSGLPGVPSSVAGATMTFARVAAADLSNFTFAGSNNHRLSLWTAIGNGNTETVTATFGLSLSDGFAEIDEWSGTATTSGGLDAVRQVVSSGPTTAANPSVSLAALQDSGSMAYGGAFNNPQQTFTPGSGFTSIAGFGHGSPLAFNESTEYQSNVTTVNWTMTSSTWFALAVEIAVSVASSIGLPPGFAQQAVPFMSNGRI